MSKSPPADALDKLQQQLTRRQLVALRDWLGEDHELLSRAGLIDAADAVAATRVPHPRPHGAAALPAASSDPHANKAPRILA